MNSKVYNRSNGTCVYIIPELGDRRNIRREFAPGEFKTIDLEELRALTYVPGGANILEDYLQIENAEVLKALDMKPEIEYHMSKEDIKELLLNGSLDRLLDCLDFAPEGVIDIVKNLSISLPLNDSAKREAILKKTGFDVDKALMRIREEQEGAAPAPVEKQRRVPETPTRRALPNYDVVTQQ